MEDNEFWDRSRPPALWERKKTCTQKLNHHHHCHLLFSGSTSVESPNPDILWLWNILNLWPLVHPHCHSLSSGHYHFYLDYPVDSNDFGSNLPLCSYLTLQLEYLLKPKSFLSHILLKNLQWLSTAERINSYFSKWMQSSGFSRHVSLFCPTALVLLPWTFMLSFNTVSRSAILPHYILTHLKTSHSCFKT